MQAAVRSRQTAQPSISLGLSQPQAQQPIPKRPNPDKYASGGSGVTTWHSPRHFSGGQRSIHTSTFTRVGRSSTVAAGQIPTEIVRPRIPTEP
eukprot:3291068-Prymnesium_polylepis.1